MQNNFDIEKMEKRFSAYFDEVGIKDARVSVHDNGFVILKGPVPCKFISADFHDASGHEVSMFFRCPHEQNPNYATRTLIRGMQEADEDETDVSEMEDADPEQLFEYCKRTINRLCKINSVNNNVAENKPQHSNGKQPG